MALLRETSLTVDTKPLMSLFERAPKVTFDETRDAMEHSYHKARKAVIDGLPGTTSRGLKALAHRGLFFTVYPRKGKPGDRRKHLSDILGVMFTSSNVPVVHEVGGTITSGRYMAIPIGVAREKGTNRAKRGFASVREASERLRAAGKDLVPIRTRGGNLVLYERTKVKSRRTSARPKRRRRGAAPRKRYKLRAAFLLTRSVTIKPTLNILATWRGLTAFRAQRFGDVPRRVLEKLQAQRTAT